LSGFYFRSVFRLAVIGLSNVPTTKTNLKKATTIFGLNYLSGAYSLNQLPLEPVPTITARDKATLVL
jgi:hypothetical protein